MALILDTGPLYAAMDRSDQHHLVCRTLLESATEELVIPSPVLVEVDYWVHKWLGVDAFVALLGDIVAGGMRVEELLDEDLARAAQICSRYRDANVGFVDAAVLAVTERLKEPKLATLDQRHFRMFRPAHVDALELLPGV